MEQVDRRSGHSCAGVHRNDFLPPNAKIIYIINQKPQEKEGKQTKLPWVLPSFWKTSF